MPHLILVRHGQSEWNLEKKDLLVGWMSILLAKENWKHVNLVNTLKN